MTQSEKLTGRPVISATGLFTPSDTITNEELVESFNRYVERHNADNAANQFGGIHRKGERDKGATCHGERSDTGSGDNGAPLAGTVQ
jgi:hypothetical protein